MGRSCKRPETLQPTRFRRPGIQGSGGLLRQGFAKPKFGARCHGETRRLSPRMTHFWAAIDPQQAAAEPRDRVSGCPSALPGQPLGEKSAFEFPILWPSVVPRRPRPSTCYQTAMLRRRRNQPTPIPAKAKPTSEIEPGSGMRVGSA